MTTQHFGRPDTSFGQTLDPTLLGVAIFDADEDDFYDVGEGLGGVTVTAEGGGQTFTTTTWEAGGYQMSVAPNVTYEVTFSGGALETDLSYLVHVGSRNVARDAIASLALVETNVPTAGDDTISGTDGRDVIAALEGDDLVLAGDGDDDLRGQDGSDILNGEEGNDLLIGGAGDDTLIAGLGEDFIDGGSGLDWVYFDAPITDFGFSGTLANLTLTQTVGLETEVNRVFDVEFFLFDDLEISATQVEDLLAANPDGDIIASDVMNVVAGTSESNVLVGTNSSDEISSGAGALDEIFGYGGADTFVFGAETSNGEVERDVIFDFNLGLDSIDLRGAEIEEVLQTSQGLVLILEGDGDAIYVQSFGLDLHELDTVLDGLI